MKTIQIHKSGIMKNLLYTTLLIFTTCFGVLAQSPTENYIKTTTYTAPSTGVISPGDTIVNVAYFDGLGRAKQSVAVGAGATGQDIISPVVYDALGRQTKAYLPYTAVTQNGNIHTDPITDLEAFYALKYPGTTNPWSEKILDSSPLARVMEQGAPGTPWLADPTSDSDHTIKFEHGLNTTDEVRLYKVTTTANNYGLNLSTYAASLQEQGFYLPGSLYKTITKDENWQPGNGNLHTMEEFKDKRGRVVLKRTYADMPGEPQGAAHDTYYVYDKFGNLSFVIPPKVNTDDGVSPEELSELCYQYVYDHKNRLVEKKIPGKGWEHIVYNSLNLPVATRDQNLEENGEWLFTKYDGLKRVAYTGIFSSNMTRENMQSALNTHTALYEQKTGTPTLIDGTEVYYNNTAFPTTNIEVLTINYYDNYTFDLDGAVEETAYGITPTTETRGLATGSKVRVLGTDQWITSVIWYDQKARPIYTYSKNPYLNTTDKLKSKLDFVGKVLETISIHTKDGLADITTIEKFSYDHAGRLLKHTHQVAGHTEETLAENVYDELGQLIQKKVGNTPAAPLQTVDYSYNIRGWLTQINDVDNIGSDLFTFNIRYNDPEPGNNPLYNGNISQTLWRTANVDNSLKDYSYSYDALNRITGAIDNTGNYNLNAVSYDKNGNILSLNRQGHINENATSFGVMDNLVYSYDSGNKLLRVEDTANDTYGFKDDAMAVPDDTDDYSYDDNGNMISDTNKGITAITYNHLNLPTQVTINGENILYIYDATGIKLQKAADGTTTQYAGAYIYENSSLKFASHSEGYIEPDGAGGYEYVYQYKDHLGNVRLSYADSNGDEIIDVSEIVEEANYYPFGLKHQGYNGQVNGTHHPYTYNGKEEQQELNLNWIDYGARNYDAALGRWMNIDPVSEFYYNTSPFNYGSNNPIIYVDPNGLWIVNIVSNTDKHGNVTYSLSFIAEKGDDINSLSTQLGISVEDILDAHPELGGKKINKGDSYGLKNIDGVKGINNTINEVSKKQDRWNCANFACGSDKTIKSQWDNPKDNNIEELANILKNNYTSVTESSSQIGTIVHYRLNSEPKTKKYIISQIRKALKAKGKTKAQIDAYLKNPKVQTQIDNMAKAVVADERHFAIVVLKNKSGTKVQNIVQKSGKEHFKFTVDDASKVGNELPYAPTPVGGTSNPYYNKN